MATTEHAEQDEEFITFQLYERSTEHLAPEVYTVWPIDVSPERSRAIRGEIRSAAHKQTAVFNEDRRKEREKRIAYYDKGTDFVTIETLTFTFATISSAVLFLQSVKPLLLEWLKYMTSRSVWIKKGDWQFYIGESHDIEKAILTLSITCSSLPNTDILIDSSSPVTSSPASTSAGVTVSHMNKIKVLFLSANPAGTPPLALDEEIREITNKIRAAEHRDSIELISRWAVRTDDLLQALNEHKPHIVHFSGHGNPTDEIILLDSNRNPKPVSKAALESLFRTLKDNVQVVVLNACYSKPQAEAITQIIDCAIGMNKAIGDKAAITFAASFYRAIGFGRSVQEAFDQGKTALLLEGIQEDSTPQLLIKQGLNADNIIPVNP